MNCPICGYPSDKCAWWDAQQATYEEAKAADEAADERLKAAYKGGWMYELMPTKVIAGPLMIAPTEKES